MKITNNPQRIEKAHYLLQRLEDQIVGSMSPIRDKTLEEANKMYIRRLELIYDEVWKSIKCLNEAYDENS